VVSPYPLRFICSALVWWGGPYSITRRWEWGFPKKRKKSCAVGHGFAFAGKDQHATAIRTGLLKGISVFLERGLRCGASLQDKRAGFFISLRIQHRVHSSFPSSLSLQDALRVNALLFCCSRSAYTATQQLSGVPHPIFYPRCRCLLAPKSPCGP